METSDYQAYLLRLWRIKSDGVEWRAQLVRVDTGEKVGFPSWRRCSIICTAWNEQKAQRWKIHSHQRVKHTAMKINRIGDEFAKSI